MKLIANIIWFILGGLWLGLGWAFLGLLLCITIIGIPLGKQCFKAAKLTFAPFGKKVTCNFDKHPIANVLFIIFGGIFQAASFAVIGVIWCITIIGIPFGKQCFKFAKLSFAPFGATIS